MKLKDIQHGERQEVIVSVRITKSQKRWLERNRINPSLIIRKALNDLMRDSIGGVF